MLHIIMARIQNVLSAPCPETLLPGMGEFGFPWTNIKEGNSTSQCGYHFLGDMHSLLSLLYYHINIFIQIEQIL